MKDFPIVYCLIVVSILAAGFFGLINVWIIERRAAPETETKLEILAEYKDSVVFDSKRELVIISSFTE